MSAIDELPGTTLERVLSVAELQTRIDRKYLIDSSRLAQVLGAAEVPIEVLRIDGRQRFGYLSTYFDTPELTAFHAAGRGRRRRFKVRTRVYRNCGDTWLEVKTRGPRGTTVKDRLPYDLAHADTLTDAGREFVAATLAGHQIDGVDVAALAPALHTAYARTTLLLDGATPSRATIDSALSWRRPGTEQALSLPGRLVIETKGGASPSALDRALWHTGIRPSRISKYGTGLAVVDDHLPELKWHRVLGRISA